MINIVKLIKECEIAVGTHVSIEFNDSTDCAQNTRISFNWCTNNGYRALSRIYTHQMMGGITDVTQIIIDDFKHQANWKSLK